MSLHTLKSYHPNRTHRKERRRFEIKMTPMIDVVFLLLIFFLLTANFRSKEGFLPAELPQQVTRAEQLEFVPLDVQVDSKPDGSCHVQIGQTEAFAIQLKTDETQRSEFDILSQRLKSVLDEQGRGLMDPIKLIPTARTKWDHVVKAYDAIWQLDLKNITFVLAE